METVWTGDPPGKDLNMRQAIRQPAFYNINGGKVQMDDLIGDTSNCDPSIVVFLRSLG